MRRYLVLAPGPAPASVGVGAGDQSLLEELGRLAAGEQSHFHVVVPRRPSGDPAPGLSARRRLAALLDALAARGLDADGEVGESSVIGSVARATERTHYDALVVPVPGIGVVDTLDLEVARRLHQIDVPVLDLVTPGRRKGAGAPRAKSRAPRPAHQRGLAIGGVLVLILALLLAVLVNAEAHHAKVTTVQVMTVRIPCRPPAHLCRGLECGPTPNQGSGAC